MSVPRPEAESGDGREPMHEVGAGYAGRRGGPPRRLETDAEAVRRDLMKLVLTIVELVRQLMERQALRRVDTGDLSDEQVEELGLALMRLEEAMTELRERFDIGPGELNLDLGPLGSLLPPE